MSIVNPILTDLLIIVSIPVTVFKSLLYNLTLQYQCNTIFLTCITVKT